MIAVPNYPDYQKTPQVRASDSPGRRSPMDSDGVVLSRCAIHSPPAPGAAVACSRSPRALTTLSTVANSGLPSADSDLYRLSRPRPVSCATIDILRARAMSPRVAIFQRNVQVGRHILLGLEVLSRVPWPRLRLSHSCCLLQSPCQLQCSSYVPLLTAPVASGRKDCQGPLLAGLSTPGSPVHSRSVSRIRLHPPVSRPLGCPGTAVECDCPFAPSPACPEAS